MGLSNKKEEELKSMPRVESLFSKSKDGKYVIHRTVITTIRPVEYFEKVLSSTDDSSNEVEMVKGDDLVNAA